MSARRTLLPRRFLRDERGTTLVELVVVTPIFLILFLALVDFGRMGGEYVMAQKAMQMAARTAIVRPPACAGVPTVNERGLVAEGTIAPRYGTACNSGATICAAPATVTCTGALNNATVAEIWADIAPLMPTGSGPANLSFSYAHNSDMGFLGGPYVPSVTVELTDLDFTFATPVGGLMALFGAAGGPGPTLAFPAMTTSSPGEDLAMGNGS